ncbi:MAG: FMN-binding protein [Rubripirellula sp.]
MNLSRSLFTLMISCTALHLVGAADEIEFLNGATMTGTVIEIRKEAKEFDFESKIGSSTSIRTYPFKQVHAVNYRGKRFVLTPRASAASKVRVDSDGNPIRSRREIEQLIMQVGASDPPWWNSTPLDFPDTLDLSWPMKPEGGWNNRKNMGQYIWDIIHPNPPKWQGGVKLVHHCMTLHDGDRIRVQRDMKTLGRMYFELLQDFSRAAYWLKRGGAEKGKHTGVMLAECFFRLGNPKMAGDYLVSRSYDAGAAARAVKLYGNMGRIEEALEMTQRIATTNASYQGFINAGDALREAGRFEEAIEYYDKVLADKNFRNEDYKKRFIARANESIDAINLFERVDVKAVPDGTYEGNSTGYNGRLNVAVTVTGGAIKAVKVMQHREKQFYSALTDTEQTILKLQTVRGVDGTSGATITSRAIVNATARALSSAAQ